MNVVIFNDSDEPFDLMKLHLGKVSNMICVIQPKIPDLQTKGPSFFRAAFCLHYDAHVPSSGALESTIQRNEKIIRSLTFGPELPSNFLFDSLCIGRFVLTKLYNGMVNGLIFHQAAASFFSIPLLVHINKAVKELCPDLFVKVSSMLTKGTT